MASLPESYNVLVTALESNSEVPKMELVTEKLLHEERKLEDRSSAAKSENALMMKHQKRNPVRCHYCKKLGWYCNDQIRMEKRVSRGNKEDENVTPQKVHEVVVLKKK